MILGSTSNICKIRVFNNLNNLDLFDIIYCYGCENWNTNDFLNYFSKNIILKNNDNISSKIKFIKGNYNIDSYKENLTNLVSDNTIIYVATPPICYIDILNYFNSINKNYKLILEKPLAKNINEFKNIKLLISNKVILCDHFIFKQDIINIIKNYNKIYKLEFHFLYDDDVESRLGYFDQVGFFIDMFPTHFLSIIYKLNKSLLNLDKIKINKNIRKQYFNYGGKNNVDTYFYIDIDINNVNCIFEAGKLSFKKDKYITINNERYKINDYENEYELLFKTILNNNFDNEIINYQKTFWELTQIIIDDFNINGNLEYYGNKF